MNIVRALDVALPDLPARVVSKNPPRLDPRVIAKEHTEKGKPIVIVKMPGTEFLFRFNPLQWKIIRMFDGNSSYATVAENFLSETGTAVSEDDVREIASYLQTESELLYKTPLEKNV